MTEHKKRLTITLAQNIYDDLGKIAKEKGLSKSAILTIALEEYSRKELGKKN